jgi:hypothetical protein
MKKSRAMFFVLAAMLTAACGPVILEPPSVDLFSFEKIGLVAFDLEKAEGKLDDMATQRFLQEVQWAQRGVQVVELGNSEEVLAEIGSERFGPDAAEAIGDRYGVAAFFTGVVRVSDIRPEINLATIVKTISIRASFTVEIEVRLIDTDSHATIWMDSAIEKKSVARLTLMDGHVPWFDLNSQEKVYRQMINHMVIEVTRDFRPVKRRLSP